MASRTGLFTGLRAFPSAPLSLKQTFHQECTFTGVTREETRQIPQSKRQHTLKQSCSLTQHPRHFPLVKRDNQHSGRLKRLSRTMTAPISGRKAEGEGIWFQTKPLRQAPINTHPRSHVGGSFSRIIGELGALSTSRKLFNFAGGDCTPRDLVGSWKCHPQRSRFWGPVSVCGDGVNRAQTGSHVPVDAHLVSPSPRQGCTPAIHSPVLLVHWCPVPTLIVSYTRRVRLAASSSRIPPFH